MDHQRKATRTPKRFLSMRSQRASGSATSSAEVSPRFLSYRKAATSSRTRVALEEKPLAKASSGVRLREPWPAFGDAIQQRECTRADTVFDMRKRSDVTRATVTNGPPTTFTASRQAASFVRLLQSEPGGAEAVSPSTSPVSSLVTPAITPPDAEVDNRSVSPNKTSRLSPTALDWVPRTRTRTNSDATTAATTANAASAALSPRLSSLSYADVARIGDGRPPPPFPLLRKINNPRPRASLASTGTIVRPGANSSIATDSGSGSGSGSRIGSELDNAHDSDKEIKISIQQTVDRITSLAAMRSSSQVTSQPAGRKMDGKVPECHGLGDGLRSIGLLVKNMDEGLSMSPSDDISLNMDFFGNNKETTIRRPLGEIARFTPSTNPCTPRPLSQSASPTDSEKLLQWDHFTPADGMHADESSLRSHWMARLNEETTEYFPNANKKISIPVIEKQGSKPTPYFTCPRQFQGGKEVDQMEKETGIKPTFQPVFQPLDDSTAVLGRQSTFTDRLVEPKQLSGAFDPDFHFAPWPSSTQLAAAGAKGGSPALPRPQAVSAELIDNEGRIIDDVSPALVQYLGDRWDWVTPTEMGNLKREPAVEIDVADVHGPLQDLLAFIDSPESWEKKQPGKDAQE